MKGATSRRRLQQGQGARWQAPRTIIQWLDGSGVRLPAIAPYSAIKTFRVFLSHTQAHPPTL